MKRRSHGRIDADGYRIVRAPDGHPLARDDGTVREHRLVLHGALGGGVHPCHWCGWEVDWAVVYRPGGSREERWSALIVDHLNGDRADNRAENLVPACPYCNSNRGGMARAGRQPADMAGIPPWERPVFGNTPAQTRRRRMPAPGRVRVPDVPGDGDDSDGGEAEYRQDEQQPVVAAVVRRGRRRRVSWRWLVVACCVPVWLVWGGWWAVVALVGWWLLVAPAVRVRRAAAPVARDRSFRSWDDVRGDLDGPASAAAPRRAKRLPVRDEPDEPDDEPGVGQLVFDLEELPVLGDEPVMVPDDDPTVGVVLPMRRPSTGRPVGPPPPPSKGRR